MNLTTNSCGESHTRIGAAGEFIGRDRELKAMEAIYESDRFELLAIHGRHRVGKTRLIREFIGERDAVYVKVVRRRDGSNLHMFRQAIAGHVQGLDADADIDDILDALSSQNYGRLILAIDDFQNIAGTADGIADTILNRMDSSFRDTKLMIVLCGSTTGFRERKEDLESQLYRVRTAEIELKQMDYYESSKFFPDRPSCEKACIYGAVGGIPMYLEKFRSGDIWRIMADEFLNDGFTLASEPEALLQQDMMDLWKCNPVFRAMAEGCTRIKDISAKSQIASPELSRLLKNLMRLGYVGKATPSGERADRRTRYFLKDNLFQFYYSAVVGKERGFLGKDVVKEMEYAVTANAGRAFEGMCSEYMVRFMECESAGRRWTATSNVNAVETRLIGISWPNPGKKENLIVEFSFNDEEMSEDTLRSLLDSVNLPSGCSSVRFALFSRGGFTDELISAAELMGVTLIGLDEMYSGR